MESTSVTAVQQAFDHAFYKIVAHLGDVLASAELILTAYEEN
jgi:hypothetical protein